MTSSWTRFSTNVVQPFAINVLAFVVLVLAATLLSSESQLFAVLTVLVIIFFAFEPFRLIMIYSVLIFYRDIFVGEVFGSKTGLLDYLTYTSNYVFILLLVSLIIYQVPIRWSGPLLWPVVIFTSVMAVTCLLSANPFTSLAVLFRLIQLLAYFFLLYTLLNSEKRIYFFLLLLLGVFFIVIIVSGYNFLLNPARLAHLARFMIFPALASGLFVFLVRNPRHRVFAWWVIAIAVAGSLTLLVTESRRVLIALAIGWASFLLVSRSRIGSIVFLVLLVIGALLYSPEQFLLRFQKTASALEALQSGQQLDEEETFNLFTGRNRLWQLGIDQFYESPLFGIGLGVSKAVIAEKIGKPLRLHNIYLELLVETGVLGLLAFAYLLFSFLALCLKMIKQHRPYQNFYFYLSVTLMSIFLIFYVTNYFGGASVFEKYEWVFYALLAAGFRVGNVWEKQQNIYKV